MAHPWKLIKKQFLAGKTPRELQELHNVPAKYVSTKASRENWVKQRDNKDEDRATKYTDKIEACLELGFDKINAILSSPTAKDSDKIAAFKSILDISGLKNSTINNNIAVEKDIQVIINRKPIKPKE